MNPLLAALCRPRHAAIVSCLFAMLVGQGARAAIEVGDDLGHVVKLAKPAARIVALGPHLVENLYAIGAGGTVVGVSRYSHYPEAARALPIVGDARAVDLERIVQLQPDLIVLWHSGFGAAMPERLRRLGMPLYLGEPSSFDDVAVTLEKLGILTGHETEARAAAVKLRNEVETISAAQRGKRPVRVFYQLWAQPLMTLNRAHFVSDMLRRCGGVNVFADADLLVPTIGTEAVVKADPEVILASGGPNEPPPDFSRWTAFPQLAAVRRRHLHIIDGDLLTRPTPRAVQALRQVCAVLDAARAVGAAQPKQGKQ